MSARVLAQGRLDPRSILLRIVERIKGVGLLIVLVALQDPGAAGVYLFVAATTIGASLVEYARYRYRLTDEALEITAGVFTRRERRIPLDRIHDVGQEQTLLRRLLGVVTVTVETASSSGAEAKLDALAPEQARALREALARVTPHPEAPQAAPSKGALLHASTPGELLLLGFTDNRAGLLVIGGLVVFQELSEALGDRFREATDLGARVVAERARQAGPEGVLVALALGLLVLFLLGWTVSAGLTWAKFHGFVLRERDGVFHRRYGLLTTREQSLPRRYLQILRLEESPLRRLVRLVVLKADNAGSALDPKNAQKAGLDVFVPAARRAAAERLVARVFPSARPRPPWRPVAPTYWRRWTLRGALLGAAVAGAGLLALPHPAWGAALALPLLSGALGLLAWRQHGWSLDEGVLAVRWGVVGRYRGWMPVGRVQAARLRATPFDRLAGVRHLELIVIGGGKLRLRYLPAADADALLAGLGLRPAPNPRASSRAAASQPV
ncbi:MAG: hypothetical protein CMN31_20085 [Sandaracinus sp.]|nr:hypothetical protein [Sandaracinus sp.]